MAVMQRQAATGRMNAHVAWVESMTEPGTEYQIVRRPNGELKCACLGWAFDRGRPKSCKHILALGQVTAMPAVRRGALEVTETAAVHAGERFRVRGIVLSGRV